MDSLTAFFKQEQESVYKPSAEFCERVMFRLGQQRPQPETPWETVLASTRPLLAAALACLLVLISMDMIIPIEPTRGATQIYLESEFNPGEALLYLESETPPTDVVFQGLIPIDGP